MTRPLPSHHLRTARLSLRPLDDDDAAALHRIWTKEAVRRFVWEGALVPPSRTTRIIAASQELFAAKGYGLWGVHTAESDDLIGFAGFWQFRDPPELELLFGLDEPRWGQGYATELGEAVVRYGIETLGMTEIRASADVGNTAMVHALEKLGFRRIRTGEVDGIETAFYALRTEKP